MVNNRFPRPDKPIQYMLSDYVSRLRPSHAQPHPKTEHGKVSRKKRNHHAKARKMPRFRTNEERVAWMERNLVKKWPEYIREDPRGWIKDIEERFGGDHRVQIYTELILKGAKSIKKHNAPNGKAGNSGMLPWNPHLVLMLDKLVGVLSAKNSQGNQKKNSPSHREEEIIVADKEKAA